MTPFPLELADADRGPVLGDVRPFADLNRRILADWTAEQALQRHIFWPRWCSYYGTGVAAGASFGMADGSLGATVAWFAGLALGAVGTAILVYRANRRPEVTP